MAKMDVAFAVSDGMGGALAGEYASRIATDKITALLPRSFQQSATGWKQALPMCCWNCLAKFIRRWRTSAAAMKNAPAWKPR